GGGYQLRSSRFLGQYPQGPHTGSSAKDYAGRVQYTEKKATLCGKPTEDTFRQRKLRPERHHRLPLRLFFHDYGRSPHQWRAAQLLLGRRAYYRHTYRLHRLLAELRRTYHHAG